MPDLLVARTSSGDLSTHGSNYDGWYSDGAYTGRPSPFVGHHQAHDSPHASFRYAHEDSEDDQDPQEVYYLALLERFAHFRAALAKSAPSSSSSPQRPQSEAANPAARQAKWSYSLRRTAPTAPYIRSLSQEQVILCLERLESILTPSNLSRHEDCRNLGAWAWSLLGKCRDLGEMSSEHVGALRQLGKTALWVAKKMQMRQVANGQAGEKEPQASSEDSEGDGEITNGHGAESELATGSHDRGCGPDMTNECDTGTDRRTNGNARGSQLQDEHAHCNRAGEMGGDNIPTHGRSTGAAESTEERADGATNLERARKRLLAKVNSSDDRSRASSDQQDPQGPTQLESSRAEVTRRAFGTLDIIVTIVGEVHGQRDLLDAREVWEEYT